MFSYSSVQRTLSLRWPALSPQHACFVLCRIIGISPSGVPTGATASASTNLLRSSGLALIVKTSLEDGDGEAGTIPGDLIKHDMTITNTGTVTLTDLSVVDSLLSVADDK